MAQKRVLSALRSSPEAPPSLSDESLALACSAGDPAALAELFDRHHPAIARYLSQLVRTPADVEDLLQTTFLQVAKGGAAYQARASVRSWLLGIATNVARHHLRSRARRWRLLEAARETSSSTGGAWPDAVSEARQLLRRARVALDELSPERRFAFVLCELEGLSAREAAAVLGVSDALVWRRVCDARRALRRLLPVEEP